jgi:hypothetical protein
MAWQEPIALLIVAFTAAVFIGRHFRTRTGVRALSDVCSCAGASHEPPSHSITFSARKGQQPRVIFRSVSRSKDSLA